MATGLPVSIENDDPRIRYAGSWIELGKATCPDGPDGISCYSGGTTAMANSTGATAEFVFDGSSVTLVGSLNGKATIDLDGAVTTLNGYGPSFEGQKVIFSRQNLRPATHTLRLTNGKRYFDLDRYLALASSTLRTSASATARAASTSTALASSALSSAIVTSRSGPSSISWDSAAFAPRTTSIATSAAASSSSSAQLDSAARIALITARGVAAAVLVLGLLVLRARRRRLRTLATLQRTLGTTENIADRSSLSPSVSSIASSFVEDKRLDDRRSRTDMLFAPRTMVESTALPSVAGRLCSPTAFSTDADPFWLSDEARTSYGSQSDMFAVP